MQSKQETVRAQQTGDSSDNAAKDMNNSVEESQGNTLSPTLSSGHLGGTSIKTQRCVPYIN
jgi:hypothetical protein